MTDRKAKLFVIEPGQGRPSTDTSAKITAVKKRLTFLLWMVVLLCAVRFLHVAAQGAARPSHGFVAAYTASRLLLEGAEAALFYDDGWFIEQIQRFEPAIVDIYINPPTTAWLMLPLAFLTYAQARIAWTILNIFFLLTAVAWLLRQLNLKGPWIPALFAFVLIYQPVYANFHLGQVYIAMLFLLVVAWHGYRQRGELLLGVTLALLLLLKLAGLMVWLLLPIQKRWPALAWGMAAILLIVLLSLPWLSLPTWQRHVEVVSVASSQPSHAVTAYQTVHSFFHHLFTFDAQWNPAPLLDAPLLGTWLTRFVFLALIGVSSLVAYYYQNHDLNFAAFVIIGLILSPWTLDYHYPLLLLPITLLLAWVRWQPAWWPWGILLAAMLLIAADLPYRSPQITAGAWAFLAYPKLYGALLLWVLTIYGAISGGKE